MFCPECGRALPDAKTTFCPFCGSRIILPYEPEEAETTPPAAPKTGEPAPAATPAAEPAVSRSKICSAALLLGAGTVVFGVFTLILRMLGADLRLLGAVAAVTFFLAPLACVFGLSGMIIRAKNRRKRGLPSAIIGLIFGVAFGLLAAACLLGRILFY